MHQPFRAVGMPISATKSATSGRLSYSALENTATREFSQLAWGSPIQSGLSRSLRLAAIEASMSGQDLRTFCPQCEREFKRRHQRCDHKAWQQRQNSRSLGCITRHAADNQTRSIHG